MQIRRIRSVVIDEKIRGLQGEAFFDWMVDRIADMLAEYNHINGTTNARLPMGLAWSFPVEQTSPRSGKLLAMGKGFCATHGCEGDDLSELIMRSCNKKGVKPEAAPPAAAQKSVVDPNDIPAPIDFFNWKPAPPDTQHQGPTASQPPPQRTPLDAPTVGNTYAASHPDLPHNQQQHHPPTTAPINLSLVEEDSPIPHISPSSNNRHRSNSLAVGTGVGGKNMHIPVRPPSFSLNTINSPDESADLLYEYFPLGLDDWMPPVDAVYRPHVVHHTKLPSDPRDLVAGKAARSRRLYSADVVG
jgi:hypothetical protein